MGKKIVRFKPHISSKVINSEIFSACITKRTRADDTAAIRDKMHVWFGKAQKAKRTGDQALFLKACDNLDRLHACLLQYLPGSQFVDKSHDQRGYHELLADNVDNPFTELFEDRR